MTGGRGVFVVVEGLDKSGKSTLVRALAHALTDDESFGPVFTTGFPDRTTCIGRTIDEYLKGAENAPDHKTCHLLFSANRWEAQARLDRLLASGTTVICDRYAYSGAAYTHGVFAEDWEWCIAPDKGLTAPNLVLYLDAGPAPCRTRMDAHERKERYEDEQKQQRVYHAFRRFTDYYSTCAASPATTKWVVIDATQDADAVLKAALEAVRTLRSHPLSTARLFCK